VAASTNSQKSWVSAVRHAQCFYGGHRSDPGRSQTSSRVKGWHDEDATENESGQDLAEYAMMIGLIALAVVVAVTLLGTTVSSTLTDIDTVLNASV